MPTLLYRTVFASRASSNHHRLALEALRLLAGPQPAGWRDVFLHHHHWYLVGAKAPDTQFKDFKNHVLHVGDCEWGGALSAARDWYGRCVGFLKAQDWKNAVACAGVMSHYLVDPFQPLHTGQTEEESIIHAALERSLSKAYPALKAILDDEGWPVVSRPPGADWLETLIREGAKAAHQNYDLTIEHFDVTKAQKAPAEALDAALLRAVARLYGRAAASLACALDAAFAEALVAPPAVNTSLDVVSAALERPVHAILNHLEDERDRMLAARQFAEFKKTGKVIRTLTEDDRTIRALHAAEVRKIRLHELDLEPARAPGAAHGRAVAETATADGRRLALAAPVVDAPAIGPKTAARLHAVGVITIADFLNADPAELSQRVAGRKLKPTDLATWQAMTRLSCALPEVRALDARLLVELGVKGPKDLTGWSSGALAQRLQGLFERLPKDAARGSKPPSAARTAKWVAAATATNPPTRAPELAA